MNYPFSFSRCCCDISKTVKSFEMLNLLQRTSTVIFGRFVIFQHSDINVQCSTYTYIIICISIFLLLLSLPLPFLFLVFSGSCFQFPSIFIVYVCLFGEIYFKSDLADCEQITCMNGIKLNLVSKTNSGKKKL